MEHNNFSYIINLREIQRTLKAILPKETQFKIGKHSISFKLKEPFGIVSVNLLSAFEINDPEQIMQVRYKDSYYGSTSLLQKKYFGNVVKDYPRFTDLVRLPKSWKNVNKIPLTSYMLELLVSYTIYKTPKDKNFQFFLERCFRTIQGFTDGRKIKPVYWEKQYTHSNINLKYSQNNMWLIDPSDPSENLVLKISKKEKDIIRSEAVNGINHIKNNEYDFLLTR